MRKGVVTVGVTEVWRLKSPAPLGAVRLDTPMLRWDSLLFVALVSMFSNRKRLKRVTVSVGERLAMKRLAAVWVPLRVATLFPASAGSAVTVVVPVPPTAPTTTDQLFWVSRLPRVRLSKFSIRFQPAGRTVRVWVSGVAAAKSPSPGWLAVIVVVPAPSMVTVLPETVATPVLELA